MENRVTTIQNGPPTHLRKAPTQQEHSCYDKELGSQWSSYLNQVLNWKGWKPITGHRHSEQGASERWHWWSRCWICLLYNDLLCHTDVQLLFEAWGMSSYAGKHCTKQPIQFFPTISLFSVPLSFDIVYLNRCPWFCMCSRFKFFCDQTSISIFTWLRCTLPSIDSIFTAIFT